MVVIGIIGIVAMSTIAYFVCKSMSKMGRGENDE